MGSGDAQNWLSIGFSARSVALPASGAQHVEAVHLLPLNVGHVRVPHLRWFVRVPSNRSAVAKRDAAATAAHDDAQYTWRLLTSELLVRSRPSLFIHTTPSQCIGVQRSLKANQIE